MLEPLLTSKHCADCKACCKFRHDELHDAPLFSFEQKIRAEELNNTVKFSQEGNLWRIKLIPLIDRDDKLICPLLGTEGCTMGEERPFDCQSWPFYIMKDASGVVVTLADDCPVVSPIQTKALQVFLRTSGTDKKFLKVALMHPDLVCDMRPGLRVLMRLI